MGILEPRKNQTLILDALELAWEHQLPVEAVFCGRCNPHYGKPIFKRIRDLESRGLPLRYLQSVDDTRLGIEYQRAHLTVFPSLAEGAGLPVVESLARGTPVLASDIGSHREYGAGGGCRFVQTDDPSAVVAFWEACLSRPQMLAELNQEVQVRTIHTWRDTALSLLEILHADPGS